MKRMRLMNGRAGLALGLLLALAMAMLLIGAACGDDDDDDGDDEQPTAEQTAEDGEAMADEADIKAAVQAAVDAWNGQDLEGFLAQFTDNGVMEVLDATREEATAFLGEFIGEPPITLGEVTNIQVSGDTATAETNEFAFGVVLEPARFSLLNEAGIWLIDGEEELVAAIPDGTTAVDLTLIEYSFEFDSAAITDANFAFNVSNIGGDQHEVGLLSVAEDLDIEAAILSGEEPPGTVVGVGGPWDPGTDTTVVFTEPLAAGRYAMLCFVEDAEGTPHAALGMINEFTIE